MTRAGRRLNIAWENEGLGTQPDYVIAARLGCATDTVRRYRYKLGIKPYADGKPTHHGGQREKSAIDWSAVDWRNKTNLEIGRELGVSPKTVNCKREKVGVRCVHTRRPKKPAYNPELSCFVEPGARGKRCACGRSADVVHKGEPICRACWTGDRVPQEYPVLVKSNMGAVVDRRCGHADPSFLMHNGRPMVEHLLQKHRELGWTKNTSRFGDMHRGSI